MKIILASSSPYRKKQLEEIGLSVEAVSPACDESTISPTGKTGEQVAILRSELKAQSLISRFSDSVIVAGDQLVEFEGRILGKPGTVEKAEKQLQSMSGKTHRLISACTIVNGGKLETFTDITEMKMHTLSKEQIANYIATDSPLNCAGSYKIESHGRWLFEEIKSKDASAIIGLPLIDLTNRLKQLGFWPG